MPSAEPLTMIILTKSEADMTLRCRLRALLLVKRYVTLWMWPFDPGHW